MPALLGDITYTWPFYAAGALAYLLGSIPFGLVLTRLAGLGDIRQIGSGNIGATNVLRTGHKGLAAATLLLDLGKGILAVELGALFGPDMAVITAGGVVIGHMFPIWLRFAGGKGVATAGGVMIALSWKLGLSAAATWLVMAAVFRYSSLAALVAAILAPLYAWLFTDDPQRTEIVGLIVLLILYRHRANIARLLRGEESKITLGGKDR